MKRRLGINIDHIATLRQARMVSYPSPVEALPILVGCGVDQVTIHLREDRRHIQDRDLEAIIAARALPVNLEMAMTEEMVGIALKNKPHTVTFVPEKREEVTTEGGLDCVSHHEVLKQAVQRLKDEGIRCSLFVDPDSRQLEASQLIGADAVELHTGTYCHALELFFEKQGHYDYAKDAQEHTIIQRHIKDLAQATKQASQQGLLVFAGHGLHAQNLVPVTEIAGIEEYNIGHAVIARAVFVGLKQAISEIQELLQPSP